MNELEQAGFDPPWSGRPKVPSSSPGACPVLVVVDVLRFTTAVEAAAARGALVAPHRWPGPGRGAALPGPSAAGGPGPYSLSPASLLGIPPGARLELASPNGATVSLAAAGAGAVVLAGCLRNASAVADAARRFGQPVGVVAAGERWPDGGLRPAVEDLVGAGAILHALGGRPSPEARAAVAAFRDAAANLPATLAACVSGRELAGRGHAADLRFAAEHDVSRVVPRLSGGAFTAAPVQPKG